MKKNKLNLRVLGDRVMIQRAETAAVSPGGIVLPDVAQDKPIRGTIVSIGCAVEYPVKNGEQVIFSAYAGQEIAVDGVKYLILKEEDLIAVEGVE